MGRPIEASKAKLGLDEPKITNGHKENGGNERRRKGKASRPSKGVDQEIGKRKAIRRKGADQGTILHPDGGEIT